jgi:hypothetical protein
VLARDCISNLIGPVRTRSLGILNSLAYRRETIEKLVLMKRQAQGRKVYCFSLTRHQVTVAAAGACCASTLSVANREPDHADDRLRPVDAPRSSPSVATVANVLIALRGRQRHAVPLKLSRMLSNDCARSIYRSLYRRPFGSAARKIRKMCPPAALGPPSRRLDTTLRDVHARDKQGSLQFRTYRVGMSLYTVRPRAWASQSSA